MRSWSIVAAAVGLLMATACAGIGPAADGRPAVVRISDRSVPTPCAEVDNVDLHVAPADGTDVGSFVLRARHPAYFVPGLPDRRAPDFTDCDMTRDPAHAFEPRRVVFWDDGRTRVVGFLFASNWRPSRVPVTVAGRTEPALHLVQVIDTTGGGKGDEVLVVYPSDGYWRIKPLPPVGRDEVAYGTSFLVGPVVEAHGRPIVEFSSLEVDPVARAVTMRFAAGGGGRVAVRSADREETVLDVTLDPPAAGTFLVLRSMFVAPDNADAALLSWRSPGGDAWTERGLDPGTPFAVDADALRLWRRAPSRHNTSAPDTVAESFAR